MTDSHVPIVALGGWGMPVSLIESWLPSDADSTCVVPGLPEPAPGECASGWLQRLLPRLPQRSLLVGWSLGGALAMLAARLWPERVASVVTLGSTPCFVARPDWQQGMPQSEFDAFNQALAADAEAARERFMALTAKGDPSPRAALRAMQAEAAGATPSPQALNVSLQWLRSLDERDFWASTSVPALHLFGDRDALVSSEVPAALDLDPARYQVLEGMSHWPRGHWPALVGAMIESFWEQSP